MSEEFNKIISDFKKNGGRITEQRKRLVQAILENPDSTCKELYYILRQKNCEIGRATVYRTINNLEEMGYISRKNLVIAG